MGGAAGRLEVAFMTASEPLTGWRRRVSGLLPVLRIRGIGSVAATMPRPIIIVEWKPHGRLTGTATIRIWYCLPSSPAHQT